MTPNNGNCCLSSTIPTITEYEPTDLFVASHDDDLDLALDDHPPEVVDGVGQGSLTGDVRVAAAGALTCEQKTLYLKTLCESQRLVKPNHLNLLYYKRSLGLKGFERFKKRQAAL